MDTLINSLFDEKIGFSDDFNDREATISDYMSLCGYSLEDAINAYNNLKEYE